ncbi:MAG: hypothetical protein WKG07_10980 [Hymenobacter sp.]
MQLPARDTYNNLTFSGGNGKQLSNLDLTINGALTVRAGHDRGQPHQPEHYPDLGHERGYGQRHASTSTTASLTTGASLLPALAAPSTSGAGLTRRSAQLSPTAARSTMAAAMWPSARLSATAAPTMPT